MASSIVTRENFESEVLKSDKPVVLILVPINDQGTEDTSDDTLEMEFYNLSIEEFKSELQKAAGEQYKIALIDQRKAMRMGVGIPIPLIYPPPLGFTVYEKGERGKAGLLFGFSKEAIFGSLKEQLAS